MALPGLLGSSLVGPWLGFPVRLKENEIDKKKKKKERRPIVDPDAVYQIRILAALNPVNESQNDSSSGKGSSRCSLCKHVFIYLGLWRTRNLTAVLIHVPWKWFKEIR